MTFSVHDQEGYERVYDDDELIEVRRGDIQALLDLATSSLDFGSGFWDEEQVEIARKMAGILGIDPFVVTPSNMACKYRGEHQWRDLKPGEHWGMWGNATRWCIVCHHTDVDRPADTSEATEIQERS